MSINQSINFIAVAAPSVNRPNIYTSFGVWAAKVSHGRPSAPSPFPGQGNSVDSIR